MKSSTPLRLMPLASILAVSLALAISPAGAAPAKKSVAKASTAKAKSKARVGFPAGSQRPTTEVRLSKGEGELIRLPESVTDVWTSNPGVADVYINNPRQMYLFGKDDGEATVFATSASGAVVYSTNVRVAQNLTSVDKVLRTAMPDADVKVTIAGQMAVLTGTVKSPDDAAQAGSIVASYLNPGVNVNEPNAQLKIVVVNRLRTATPLQVNLQVKIAEVNRSLLKEFGTNITTRDTTNGFNVGIAQGRDFGTIRDFDTAGLPKLDASSVFGLPAGSISLPFDPRTGQFVTGGTTFDLARLGLGAGKTAIGLAGRLFGVDVAAALDLAESEGLLTTLAQPNLTALSGETASFLAGGEIPIPLSTGLGQVSVEYKQYGVSLAFTPLVLDNGRISMRVRPEVSELTNEGSVRLNGFSVPGISTRRTETTVELGSGQSFMIAGLMRNNHTGTVDRTPGAGNVPVLGALFRSQSFRRSETELVIIVTPYLVQPVNANDIVLPTDGYKSSTDVERILLGKMDSSKGEDRPKPSMAPPARAAAPGVQGASAVPTTGKGQKDKKVAAAPGFGGN
jgi:pilus assembly protein CpaC